MRSAVHILIVDDDPSLANAARALLSRRGCLIDAVFSGLDAVSRVRAGGIDAVLLDVWMPEVNGLSVLEEISRLPNPPRVVLMSGHIDHKVDEAVASGRAAACLPKPVDFEVAVTLLAGEAPDRPLPLRPSLAAAEIAAVAAQALARGSCFVEGAPQLPPGTPVALELAGSSAAALVGVADPSPRPAGRRGLVVKLAELTGAQEQALRALASAAPVAAEPTPAVRQAPPDRALELYRRGMEKLEGGLYEKALLDLRAARDFCPTDALMAAAALRAEELAGVEKARSLFREAEALGERDPKEALRLVEDAIRLDPTRASYHREAARLTIHVGGAAQQAEERLAAAIHLAPSDPSPRIHLTQLLERAGRFTEALWACEAAMHLFPGDQELQRIKRRLKRKVHPERPAP